MTSSVSLTILADPDAPVDEAWRQRLADELRQRIRGEVRFGAHDRMLYATDASIYQVEPLGVVVPRDGQDIEAIVGFCSEHELPLLPRGGGTSLAGQAVNRAIVVDFSAWCNRVLEIDAARATARVESGVVLDHLNAALAAHGLMFGPDVATSAHATIGGMIGNNSAGAHSILYGRTVEHLKAVEVLLASGRRLRLAHGAAERNHEVAELTRRVADVVQPLAGEIRSRYPRTRRRVDGYNLDLMLEQLERSTPGTFDHVNLAHLICGAEGTLGVVPEAELSLVPAPSTKGLAVIAFASVDAALEAVAEILPSSPAAVELLDDIIMELARSNLEYRHYVDLMPRAAGGLLAAVLYVEYFGETAEEIRSRLDWVRTHFGDDRVRTFEDAPSMASAWKLRKAGEPLLHGRPDPRKPVTFIEDTAVDPADLPEFIRQFRGIIEGHGTIASIYAHASVGCLHVRPMISLKDHDDLRAMEAIAAEATDLVRQFGGALSGEHGDGRLRSHLLERFFGPGICDGFRAIKAIFDPQNRMNPGNITEPAAMTQQLRVRPRDRFVDVPDVSTFFRYRREHGFGSAVEMCNGAGVCRKTSGGTMCPSYRATRDERHATRGRGNALRLAITGQFNATGAPAWGDPETLQTLDLCLSCKACKSECPSSVDLAKLKAEYLAQTYRSRGGAPLTASVFGAVRELNRFASLAPSLSNAVQESAPARWLLHRTLGIDRRRSLPPFGRSLYRWFRQRRPADIPRDAPAVVLFPDCFTVYNEPDVGIAAVEVLEALGYRVMLPRAGCCGRAAISQGLLPRALRIASQTAEALQEAVESSGATAVVGCEPSCISAIVDDWPDLKLSAPVEMIERLAQRTMLIEDFLESGWSRHPRGPDATATESSGPVLLHGHCHQKALWGTSNTVTLLNRFAERVETLDSGCCGMAGSFGFSAEHFDLSMQIGELALFPALRAFPDATVMAPGTSCRHQIRDGLGRRALHPVQLIAQRLGD